MLRRASTLPSLASLLSFLMITWAMWAAWDVRSTMPEVRAHSMAVYQLLGQIDRLDEGLTAAVQLAASTGDSRWEERYDRLEREVTATVDSVMWLADALQPEVAGDGPTGATDDPSDAREAAVAASGPGRLAELERQALALVRNGDPEGAWSLLESEEYAAAKAGYERRKAGLLASVASAVETAERETDARLKSVVAASGASFLLLLLVWGVVVSARGAREQRRLEARLRRSEERLRSIMDVAPLAIVRVDRRNVVQFWNPAAERIFGWEAEEVLGKPYPLAGEKYEAEAQELFEQGFAGKALEGAEIRRLRKDGSEVDLRMWHAAARDESGDVVGLVGVFADVTEQRVLEERLRQAHKLEAVGRLAGGIAHDFNNVMTAVLGHAELLLERLPAQDPATRDIEEICRSADRATRLTSQLLAFSRQQVLQPRVLDLATVVAGTDAMLRRLIGEDIRLELSIADELGRVEADPTQIEQVLLNLAVNARDAMPGGGALTLRLENTRIDTAAGRLLPDDIQPGEYVRLSVADTGDGMDEETLARVFEPFFTTKDLGGGTGLGLATVFGIVKQSGGYCRVRSQVGHGTEVEVLLPRVEKPLAASTSSPADADDDAGRGETVLLVEDDDAVRSLVQRVLQRRGYHVLEAADPGEALLAVLPAHTGPVDLLVTDIVMPEMDGYELANHVAALYPGIPTIFMSGYTEDEVVRRGIVTGSNVFLQKPFGPPDLTRSVRDVLDRVAR